NRFIEGVHLGGIFLIAVALAAPLRWAISRTSIWSGWYVTAALTLTMLVLLPVYSERASYLGGNTIGLRESRQGLAEEAEEFSALLETLEQLPPGRVYAGQKLPQSGDIGATTTTLVLYDPTHCSRQRGWT
ncbi:MAG: hypothetical protein CMJ45_03595, partial [Planctomyces sp.]|nr:hypothetical protein [Planctomyces sp.]